MEAIADIGNFALIALLVLLNGFFVAAEFTIVKVRPFQLEEKIAQGDRRARYAHALVEHIDVSLSVTQLGITLVSLGLGWVGEPFLATFLEPLFARAGISGVAASTTAFTVAFSLITAAHIIIGELAPKNIAIQTPLKVLLIIALPLYLFQQLAYPFVWVLNHMANAATHALGFEVAEEASAVHSEAEIRVLMAESLGHGVINKTEYDFVDNVFDFSDKEARDVMVPRTDMVCLYLDDLKASINQALHGQFTRYPLCREDKDDIIGFLHIKDLLDPLSEGKAPNLRKLARDLLFVPETMPIPRLLKTMQQQHMQLAVVVDEYGGTAGLVTLEDIVEEIVGDIRDEFDKGRAAIERKGERLFSVDAKTSLDELHDVLELDMDSDADERTLGGWMYSQVEPPPSVGQKAVCEKAEFFVEEVGHLSITRVLVRLQYDLAQEHEEILEANG